MDKYYVYVHRHPRSKEIIYIGMGQKDRAWTITSKARHIEHKQFLEELGDSGFIASDWTQVVARQMTKAKAYEYERELISIHKPKFNRDRHQRCMTAAEIDKAAELRQSGKSYEKIAKELGFNSWTVWTRLRKRET